MRLRFPILAVLGLCSLAAHATPVTYSIAGYLNTDPLQKTSVTGMTTLNIFTPNPSVLSIYLNFANGTSQNGIGTKGQDGGHTVYVGASNDMFNFTDDLHNYTPTGGTFNLQDVSGNYVGAVFNGTLTPISPTPEPSSLALLATGLVGAAGVLRKRLA